MITDDGLDRLFRSSLKRRTIPHKPGELEDLHALLEEHNRTAAAPLMRGKTTIVAGTLAAFALAIWGLVQWDPGEGTNAEATANHYATGTPVQQAVENTSHTTPHFAHTEDRISIPQYAVGEDGRAGHGTEATIADGARSSGSSHVKIHDVGADRSRRTHTETLADAGGLAGMRDPVATANAREDAVPQMQGMEVDRYADIRYMRSLSIAPGADPTAHAPIHAALTDGPFARMRGSVHAFVGLLGASPTSPGASENSLRVDPTFRNKIGVEYTAHLNRWAFATGIHYTAYEVRPALVSNGIATPVTLDYMQLPLLAGYGVARQRWSAGVQGGVLVDFLFTNVGPYTTAAGQALDGIPDGAFNSIVLSATLRGRIGYHLTDRFGLHLEPVLEHQLTPIASDGPFAGLRYISTGAQFGLTYLLPQGSTY